MLMILDFTGTKGNLMQIRGIHNTLKVTKWALLLKSTNPIIKINNNSRTSKLKTSREMTNSNLVKITFKASKQW